MSQHSWLQNFSRSLTFQIINHDMIYNIMIISLLYYLTWNRNPHLYCGSIKNDMILGFRVLSYQNMLQNRKKMFCTFIVLYDTIKYKFLYRIWQFPWPLNFVILSENDMKYHPSIFVTIFFFSGKTVKCLFRRT